jgi:hypothetical protein
MNSAGGRNIAVATYIQGYCNINLLTLYTVRATHVSLVDSLTLHYTIGTLFTSIYTHIKSNSLRIYSKPNKKFTLFFALLPVVNFD